MLSFAILVPINDSVKIEQNFNSDLVALQLVLSMGIFDISSALTLWERIENDISNSPKAQIYVGKVSCFEPTKDVKETFLCTRCTWD